MKKKILISGAALSALVLLNIAWRNSGLYCSHDITVKVQIKSLSDRVKEFRRDCNRIPTNGEGLQVLVRLDDISSCPNYSKDGYIEGGKVPVDPWNQEFKYESDGRKFKISTTHDGQMFVSDGQDVKIYER